MTRSEPLGCGPFLDAIARAWVEEDDVWQFEAPAGGSTLVARDDDDVVALVEAGSLDATVTVDDVVRVADLAARVGAAALSAERPAAFLCSRRTPSAAAVQAAYLRNLRILGVRSTGEDSWGYDMAVLSHQEFRQPPDAAVLGQSDWDRIHAGSDNAVFRDARQTPIASFAGMRALLAWQEESEVASWGSPWGSCHFELPAGTTMTVAGLPPLPVAGVVLRFHKETRPLRATREASAFAELASLWLWGS